LGAGGAARAIAVELALAGVAAITIVNRSPQRGQDLVDLLTQKTSVPTQLVAWHGDYALPADAELVINATSIGLNDDKARVPVAPNSWKKNMIAADVIFNPPQTKFLREAAQHGCRTLDGLGMLVNQAVISFRIWTGVTPDDTVMREALEEFVGF
jgi:shikimate dehydrogenase